MLQAVNLMFSFLPPSLRLLFVGVLIFFFCWVLLRIFLAIKDLIF